MGNEARKEGRQGGRSETGREVADQTTARADEGRDSIDRVKGSSFYHPKNSNKLAKVPKQGQLWCAQVHISKRCPGFFSVPGLLEKTAWEWGASWDQGDSGPWRKAGTFKSSPSLTKPPQALLTQYQYCWSPSAGTSLCPSGWLAACLYP